MRLAFTLEYDGTDFSGFQLQKNAITIQEHLEKAIKEITATDIKINYSGRTDAGVHAISQVFDFETEIKRDDNSWIRGINSNLPKSIAVKNIFHVPTDFNSRFSALERRYAYVIYNSTNKPLFFDKFSHWITNEIDLDEMKIQLEMFLGEHNFTSFRSSSCNAKNPRKKITNVEILNRNKFIFITITANAFLQNMMRIICGTLLDISKKELKDSLSDIIHAKDRKKAGKTLGPQGLFFLGPEYNLNGFPSPVSNVFERLKI